MGSPLRKTLRVLWRDGQCARENISNGMDVRVTLDAMGLAKVCLVDTVDFGKLDVLPFECGGCLLVVGS